MKQWLTIFLLIWGMATVCADGERVSANCPVEIRASEVTSLDPHVAPPDNAPLLATAFPIANQLFGASRDITGKNGRHTENPENPTARINSGNIHLAAQPIIHQYAANPPSMCGRDRYIYFLRRIII